MNKQELQQHLEMGYKMTHLYFSHNEYIYLKDGEIHDESGYKMKCIGPNNQVITFWTDRQSEDWNEGWEIYHEQTEILSPPKCEFKIHNYRIEDSYCYLNNKKSKPFVSKSSHKRTNKKRK